MNRYFIAQSHVLLILSYFSRLLWVCITSRELFVILQWHDTRKATPRTSEMVFQAHPYRSPYEPSERQDSGGGVLAHFFAMVLVHSPWLSDCPALVWAELLVMHALMKDGFHFFPLVPFLMFCFGPGSSLQQCWFVVPGCCWQSKACLANSWHAPFIHST